MMAGEMVSRYLQVILTRLYKHKTNIEMKENKMVN